MSKPPIASEPWMKTPTVKVEPGAKGPSNGGFEGQLVAVEGDVMQTRPIIGGDVTITAMLTECERLPLVPVTVNVKFVPPATLVGTETVMLEVAEPPGVFIITGLGVNVTVTPEGTGLLASPTLPVKLPIPVTVRVSDAVLPDCTDMEFDAATRLKLGGSEPVVATVAP